MKKRLLAMLLALTMVLSMVPAIASAAEITEPTIISASLTLNSVLSLNITVDLLGDDPANYELYAAIGTDEKTQVTEYTATDDGKCVYTVDLMAHRACETVNLSLESGGYAFSSLDWTLAKYVSAVKTDYAADTAMCNLVDALYHYCQYADYYADTALDGLVIDAVAAVKADDLGTYAQDIQIANSALKPVAYLYLDEACDLGFKFDKTAMEGKTLYVDGSAVTTSEVGTEQVGYKISEILPQDWDTMHEVIVKDGDTVIFQLSYGVLSYARQVLLRSAEIKPDLKGLTASMYLYNQAADAYIVKPATEFNVTLSQEVKRDRWWAFEMFLEGENVKLGPANGGITVEGDVLLDGVKINPWFMVSDYDWETGNYALMIKTSDGQVWADENAYNADKTAEAVHHMTVKAGTKLIADGKTYTVTADANYRISMVDGEYKWRATTDAYMPVTLNSTVKRHWWWGMEMYLDGTEDVFTASSGITVSGTGEYVDGAKASPWFVVSDYDWDTGKYPIIIKTENIWANQAAYDADAAAGTEHTVTVKAGTLLTIDGKVYTVAEDISYCISTINGEYKWRQVEEVTLGQEIKRDRWHEFEMFLVGDDVKLSPANSGITVIGDVLLDGIKIDPWFVVSDWAPGDDGNYLLSIKTSDGKVWADNAAYEADKAAGTEHLITVMAGTKLLTSEGVLYRIAEDANYRISNIDGAYNWRYTTEGYTPPVQTEFDVTLGQEVKRDRWWAFELFLEGENVKLGPANGGVTVEGDVLLDGVKINPWFMVSDYDWETGNYALMIKTSDGQVWADENAYNADISNGVEHHITVKAGTRLIADGKTYTVTADANYRISLENGEYKWHYTTDGYVIPNRVSGSVNATQTRTEAAYIEFTMSQNNGFENEDWGTWLTIPDGAKYNADALSLKRAGYAGCFYIDNLTGKEPKVGDVITFAAGDYYNANTDKGITLSTEQYFKWNGTNWESSTEGFVIPARVEGSVNDPQNGTDAKYIEFTMSLDNGFEADNWDVWLTVPAGAMYNGDALSLKRAGGAYRFYIDNLTGKEAQIGDIITFAAGDYYNAVTDKGITLIAEQHFKWNGTKWEATQESYVPSTEFNVTLGQEIKRDRWHEFELFLVGDNLKLGPASAGIVVEGDILLDGVKMAEPWFVVSDYDWGTGNYALSIKTSDGRIWNDQAARDADAANNVEHHITVKAGTKLMVDGKTYTVTEDANYHISNIDGAYNWRYTTEGYTPTAPTETSVTLSQEVKRDWWWGTEMYLEGENAALTTANSGITVEGDVLVDGAAVSPWFVVSDYDWGTGNYPIIIKTECIWANDAAYQADKAAGTAHWLTVKAGTKLTIEGKTYTVAADANYCISLQNGEYKWRAVSNAYSPVTLNSTVKRHWWWGMEMYLDGTEDVFTASSGITVAGTGEYVDGAKASPWFVVSDYDWGTGKYPIVIKTENIWASEAAYNADAAAGVEHTVTVKAGTLLTIDGKTYTVTENISYLISTINGEYKWRQVKEVTLGQEIKRDRWHEFEMFLVGDDVKLSPANSGITVIGDVLLDGTKIDPWFVVSDYDWETGNYALSIKTSDGKVWADSAAYEADKAAGTERHITVKAGTKLLTSEGVLYKVTEDANYRISLIDGAYNWRYTTEGYTPDVELTEYALTADSKIIVPANAGTTTTYAANELQSFLAQTSGLTLEIAEQGTALNSGVLNFSLNDQGACPAIADGKKDSFATVMDGGVLHIYGGSERGVLYGVYDFLEDKLGVRFISASVTHIPTVSQIVLNADYSVMETPAVEIRSYWTTETQLDPAFAARKRIAPMFASNPVDGGMARDYYNPGHNLNALITLGGGTVPSQVCLSDSTLRGYLVTGMEALIAQNPSASYFALKLEDGYNPTSCTCGTCSGKSDSDLLMDLCNYVAQQVNADSGREIYIVTYAYGTTEVPPTISVDSHVVVELAPITNANFGFAYNDSRQSDAFRSSVAGWQAKVPGRLWFYDYGTNYNNYSWYLSDLSLMLTNYQYMANTLGSDSIIVEGNHIYQNDWQQALRVYVASKLLWNPNGYTQADVMALVEEFCTYYFGDAAVYQYIVAMENNMATVRNDDSYFVAASDHTLSGTNYQTDTSGVRHTLNANYYNWYTADFIKSQITSLEAAYNGATGTQKNRIAQVLFTAKLMYFANYVEYENKLTWIFKYDTYTRDDTYNALKDDISELLTVLDNGYNNGSYRAFYNSLLFKSMLEIAGSDKDATLVPGTTQGITFLTNAADGTAAGIYVWLEQDGEARMTSDWAVASGTSTTQIVNNTTGASKTVTIKGTGVNNRFFFDYDGFAGAEGQTATITISAGTIEDNGYTWTIASDITVSLTYTNGLWTVALA